MPPFPPETIEAAMREALTVARTAATEGEFPFGAVILAPDGSIIARAFDTVVRDSDPTRHAEIEAVRAAIRSAGPDLSGHALISTTEACAMCSAAAWWAGISLHAYGISQARLKRLRADAIEEPMLPTETLFAGMKRKMQVIPGVLEPDCTALWLPA